MRALPPPPHTHTHTGSSVSFTASTWTMPLPPHTHRFFSEFDSKYMDHAPPPPPHTPPCPPQAEAASWTALLEVRDTVNGALEKARAAKLIGSSLDASVLLHVSEPTFQVGGWVGEGGQDLLTTKVRPQFVCFLSKLGHN